MAKMGNLDANLGVILNYFFIMVDVGNLYRNIGGCFDLSFVMAEVGNLDAKLGVTLCIFHNGCGG
jgi:hypothetical protein